MTAEGPVITLGVVRRGTEVPSADRPGTCERGDVRREGQATFSQSESGLVLFWAVRGTNGYHLSAMRDKTSAIPRHKELYGPCPFCPTVGFVKWPSRMA
jgi:hypothetical protein